MPIIKPHHIAAARAQLERERLTSQQLRQRVVRLGEQCVRHLQQAREALRHGNTATAQYLLACWHEARSLWRAALQLLAVK